MADWHLDDLYKRLTGAGWQVTEHPGDENAVSGTWELQRSIRRAPIVIDFSGQGDMHCLPMTESYGCRVRGPSEGRLYFGKKGRHWDAQLAAFVASLQQPDEKEH